MNQENCHVVGCRNPKIVGMQREIQILPSTQISEASDQQLEHKKIVYKLFCEDHAHLRNWNAKMIRARTPGEVCSCERHSHNPSNLPSEPQLNMHSIWSMYSLNKVSNSEDNSDEVPTAYPNRKRKAVSPSTQTEQIKINDKEVMPEKVVSEKKDSGSDASVEDDDCYITNEQSPTITNLSVDDNDAECEEDTSKTIETEPESESESESSYFEDSEGEVSQLIDLTTEQDDDNAAPEQKNQNVDLEGNSNSVNRDMTKMIDLTSDDEALPCSGAIKGIEQ